MASFVGAITSFNPYIQQIPTEAYTKVGMFKEQQYEAGVAKTQESIDKIAGLDIANTGGREYLRNRVNELTSSLNKYSAVDFSNPNNVSQLTSLSKPLYQDENIVNDVINTGIYRNWDKVSRAKMEKGDMDPIQYAYEQQDVAKWLNSDVAGSQYTGRTTPNDSTYEKITKKVLDFKSKLKQDVRYTSDNVFTYGLKNYKVSELSELFYNQILDGNDREVLAHNSMYDDSLRYNLDPNSPKNDLLGVYNNKKQNNEILLKKTDIQIQAFKDKNDPDYQSLLQDRDVLRSNIETYQRAINSFSQVDPTNESQKMGLYTNISAENYKNSLSAIFESEQTEPKYRDDVKQSRDHKNATLNAAVAKGTVAYTQLKGKDGQPMWDDSGNPIMGIRAVLDEENDPTILEKQSDLIQTVDANGNIIYTPRTGKSGKKVNPLVSLLQGTPGEMANYNVAGEEDIIHLNKNILSNQFYGLDGSIQQNILAMTKTLERGSTAGFKLTDYYSIEQAPGPDGKDQAMMVWKSPEKKKEFMSYVSMLNSAYEIEAADGNTANKSFTRFLNGEIDATSQELGLQGTDPKVIQDLMTLKGKNAVISMMDEVFKDKSVTKNLESIDAAIEQKRVISSPWRKVLYANAKNQQDRDVLDKLTDEQIMRLEPPQARTIEGIFNVSPQLASKIEDWPITMKYSPNGDGTFTATAYSGFGGDGIPIPSAILSRSVPASAVPEGENPKIKEQYSKYTQGATKDDRIKLVGHMGSSLTGTLFERLTGGSTNPYGLSGESITKANKELEDVYSVIRQNVTRTVSLLNLPENKQDKDAVTQAVTNSIINQAGSKLMGDPSFIQLNNSDVSSITKITDITGASNKAIGDIFNSSGFLNIQFEYQDTDGKTKSGTGAFNIDRILATDPGFSSKFSKYFAGLKYAKEGAAIRVHSYIDPTSGYQNYSGQETGRTVSPVSGNPYTNPQGYLGEGFTRFTVPTSDNHQVPINYKVVSYGNAAALGNKLNNTDIDNDRYAIQFQVNTPSGKQNIFLKSLDGNIKQYNTPEEALYQLKDELFKNVPVDHPADFIKDKAGNNTPNYFIELDNRRPSLRGFFNTQMRLNGHTLPNMEEIKKAYANLVAGQTSSIDKELLKFSPIY